MADAKAKTVSEGTGDLLDQTIAARVTAKEKEFYEQFLTTHGVKSSDVLREVIQALIAGKLKIIIPKNYTKATIKGVHTHA